MKISEISGMKQEDLQGKLEECQKRLFELRCQHVTENLQDCKSISNCRKDIARIKTVIKQNQLKVQ